MIVDYLFLEIFLIFFNLIMLYVISHRYIGIHIIISVFSIIVILGDFVLLSSIFITIYMGAIFWTGIVLYCILMPIIKLAIFFDKIQLE